MIGKWTYKCFEYTFGNSEENKSVPESAKKAAKGYVNTLQLVTYQNRESLLYFFFSS